MSDEMGDGTQQQPHRASPRNVPGLLLSLQQDRFSGAVSIAGSIGGTIHLHRGTIRAIETPGAPTAEALLLKSRRIGEQEWDAACTAAGPDGPLDTTLVDQGHISAAELEIVCVGALYDAAFVMALSTPDSWQVDREAPTPRLSHREGTDPRRLTEETSRRVRLLAKSLGSVREFGQGRVRPSARATAGIGRLSARYRDILLSADGRRSPRDIAFALGRGVYPVMLDISRMKALQLIQPEPPQPPATAPRVAPRDPAAEPPRPAAPTGGGLPRRTPADRRPESTG
ncbi:hypothetical protein [Streptomyces sp. RTd22]|uniref:hypothetical protein n=1 Tax=Streptomyces sp. RTd22 TaxID=1841249 RepID=UPI001F1913DA|nr:hypothetical protein [Streptomyces sp. RTd22]